VTGRRAATLLLACTAIVSMLTSSFAFAGTAEGCRAARNPWGVTSVCHEESSGVVPAMRDGSDSVTDDQSGSYEFVWTPACSSNQPSGDHISQDLCLNFTSCQRPHQFRWVLWGRLLSPTTRGMKAQEWQLLTTTCQRDKPTSGQSAPPVPQVTWQMVLNAVRRVGLPALTVQVQPADQTLVNFDTIFYAEPSTFTRTLTMLGRTVDVEAQPAEYHWHFGDGAVATTTTPGAPYPAKTIVHQYADAHVTMHPSVDVLYSVRFRVDQGVWQGIAERIDIPGPAVDLRTREATPVLSGQG
jgi:hypothetical protein